MMRLLRCADDTVDGMDEISAVEAHKKLVLMVCVETNALGV